MKKISIILIMLVLISVIYAKINYNIIKGEIIKNDINHIISVLISDSYQLDYKKFEPSIKKYVITRDNKIYTYNDPNLSFVLTISPLNGKAEKIYFKKNEIKDAKQFNVEKLTDLIRNEDYFEKRLKDQYNEIKHQRLTEETVVTSKRVVNNTEVYINISASFFLKSKEYILSREQKRDQLEIRINNTDKHVTKIVIPDSINIKRYPEPVNQTNEEIIEKFKKSKDYIKLIHKYRYKKPRVFLPKNKIENGLDYPERFYIFKPGKYYKDGISKSTYRIRKNEPFYCCIIQVAVQDLHDAELVDLFIDCKTGKVIMENWH